MRTLWMSLFTISLLACDGEAIDDSGEPADGVGEEGDRSILCEASGSLDFQQTGAGLDAHEGQRVWVAAVQPEEDPHSASVTVLLQTRIEAGTFSTGCSESLSENYRYPSSAVIIDADGSGDCSAGDRFAEELRYGWADDVLLDLSGDERLQTIGDRTTWGGLGICDYYVPADLIE